MFSVSEMDLFSTVLMSRTLKELLFKPLDKLRMNGKYLIPFVNH